jgi:hypothetical protein
MRCRLVFVFILAAALPAAALPAATVPAFAQTPPGANTLPSARGGNALGTGGSQPLSSKPGNITPGDTSSLVAGRLPDPSAGEDSTILGYLLSARGALAAGRDGEAQEALERAETRALDRSVPLFKTDAPDRNKLVQRIHQVLMALGNGDRMGAMQRLESAIATAGP